MNRVVVVICLLLSWSAVGQEIKVSKYTIESVLDLSTNVRLSQSPKNQIVRAATGLDKSSSIKNVRLGDKTLVTVSSSEEIIFFNNDFHYKMVYKSETRLLVKVYGGKNVASLEIPVGEEVIVTDVDGNFVVVDYSHGDGGAFSFYSPEFQRQNIFTPFPNGFSDYELGFSGRHVCIYIQETSTSKVFNLAVLDTKGKLIVEKTFERGQYLASDLEVANENISILLNSTNGPTAKILTYNLNLESIWVENLSSRVMNYELIISEKNNEILVATLETIRCLNMDSGKTKWTSRTSSVSAINESTIFSIVYAGNEKHIAVCSSSAFSKNNTLRDNLLSIVDSEDGKIVYKEQVSTSHKIPKLFTGMEGFYFSNNDYVVSYKIQ